MSKRDREEADRDEEGPLAEASDGLNEERVESQATEAKIVEDLLHHCSREALGDVHLTDVELRVCTKGFKVGEMALEHRSKRHGAVQRHL